MAADDLAIMLTHGAYALVQLAAVFPSPIIQGRTGDINLGPPIENQFEKLDDPFLVARSMRANSVTCTQFILQYMLLKLKRYYPEKLTAT